MGDYKLDTGYKDQAGKVELDLLPVEALEVVGMVATQGARRVAARNWEKGMPWSKPYAAILRHLFAYWRGEDLDPKHRLPHLAHAAFWMLALLDFWIKDRGADDRPKNGGPACWATLRRCLLEAMNQEDA